MASKNLAGLQLASRLLDQNLSPEDLGPSIGISGMTLRRCIDGEPLSRSSKWVIARYLGEDPSTYWPPMPGKRQPGGSRTPRKVAA